MLIERRFWHRFHVWPLVGFAFKIPAAGAGYFAAGLSLIALLLAIWRLPEWSWPKPRVYAAVGSIGEDCHEPSALQP